MYLDFKKFTIEYDKFYQRLIHDKNFAKFAGLRSGFEFLDGFLEKVEAYYLVDISGYLPSNRELYVYNYKCYKFNRITVSDHYVTQNLFENCYLEFINDTFFCKFPWYKNLFDYLKTKFEFIEGRRYCQYICNFFLEYHNEENIYDYKEFLRIINIDFLQFYGSSCCEKNVDETIKQLFEEEIFVKIDEYKFKINDFYMNTLFGLTSFSPGRIVGPLFYSGEDYELALDARAELKNFNRIAKDFDKRWKKSLDLSRLQSQNFESLFDYSKLKLDENIIKNIPEDLKNLVLKCYYYKMLLNEYLMHLVIMSCFQGYFSFPNLKNILSNNPGLKKLF